jgi:hypothetical protein
MDRDDTRNPDSPPSREELAEAEALRDALGTSAPNAAADFARALSLSHSPRPLAVQEHRALVDRAIARSEACRVASQKRRRRAVVGVASGLALAAAIALVVGRAQFALEESAEPMRASIEPLIPLRSTQSLFPQPFARRGGESARIDRIASARGSDLRDNRFTTWGVK